MTVVTLTHTHSNLLISPVALGKTGVTVYNDSDPNALMNHCEPLSQDLVQQVRRRNTVRHCARAGGGCAEFIGAVEIRLHIVVLV